MTVFKDVFQKMIYGFAALFLLSFAIEAAQKFEIEIEERNFHKILEQDTSDDYLSESSPSHEEKRTHFAVNNTNPNRVPLGILKGYAKEFFNRASLLKKDGSVLDKRLLDEFLASLNLGTSESWENFKKYLNQTGPDRRRKGIAAEVATAALFTKFNYIQLENVSHTAYTFEYNEGKSCTTKFGADNGIDGIFIPHDEKDNFFQGKLVSHIIINEAKFSEGGSPNFRLYDNGNIKVQQSHSMWNEEKYKKATCTDGTLFENIANYAQQPIIRTATLLNGNGEIKLYEVKDADAHFLGNDRDFDDIANDLVRKSFASQASPHLHIHHIYSQFQRNVEGRGYTLQ